MDQIADMVVSASEGVINRQKQHILGTSLAIASLFDKGKPMERLFKEMDAEIGKAKSQMKQGQADSVQAKEEKRQSDMRRSMENLNKLRMFMGK